MPLITSAITGVDAVVSGFPTLGFVEITRTIDSGPIADSSGQGGIDRVPGNVDFTGKLFAYGYKPPYKAFPNQDFALSFTENGTNLVSCSAVKCIGLEIMVPAHDKTGKNAMFYIVHFGADGVDLSIAAAGGPAANTDPTKYPSKGLAPYLGMGTSYTRQTNSQWQHLLITAEVERKVNSDCGGSYTINGVTYYSTVYFRPAGMLDWKFTYNEEVNSMGLLPPLNGIYPIRMQTNPKVNGGADSGAGSVGYWLLQYGIVANYDAKIDHASRLPIAYDVTLEKCNNGTSACGIWTPDGIEVFPSYNPTISVW